MGMHGSIIMLLPWIGLPNNIADNNNPCRQKHRLSRSKTTRAQNDNMQWIDRACHVYRCDLPFCLSAHYLNVNEVARVSPNVCACVCVNVFHKIRVMHEVGKWRLNQVIYCKRNHCKIKRPKYNQHPSLFRQTHTYTHIHWLIIKKWFSVVLWFFAFVLFCTHDISLLRVN